MKQKWVLLFILPIMLIACRMRSGSGVIVTEDRKTGHFKGVKASQSFDVIWRQGSEYSVRIEADDNVIEDVRTRVSDGILQIGLEDISVNNATLKAYISSPSLNWVETSSAATFTGEDIIRQEGALTVKSSSAGNIEVEIDAPKVIVDASSGSDIVLKGRTRMLEAEASSGSSVKIFGLLSEQCKARSSSGSTLEVYASVKLDAHASSGASVHYRGGAPDVRQSESSGGSVQKD